MDVKWEEVFISDGAQCDISRVQVFIIYLQNRQIDTHTSLIDSMGYI